MPVVVLAWRAEAQIIDVLDYTLEEFGEAKYLEYRDLIGLALRTLEATPTHGKRRPEMSLPLPKSFDDTVRECSRLPVDSFASAAWSKKQRRRFS